MPFCASCGKQIPADNTFCPYCGAPVPASNQQAPGLGTVSQTGPGPQVTKNLLVALVLSFIFPGLGQYYSGQKRRGRRFIVVGIILLLTILFEIGVILYPIFWLYSMVDTFLTVRKVNAGLPPN
jgi:TM2 domain-containing membrane protein YozV